MLCNKKQAAILLYIYHRLYSCVFCISSVINWIQYDDTSHNLIYIAKLASRSLERSWNTDLHYKDELILSIFTFLYRQTAGDCLCIVCIMSDFLELPCPAALRAGNRRNSAISHNSKDSLYTKTWHGLLKYSLQPRIERVRRNWRLGWTKLL